MARIRKRFLQSINEAVFGLLRTAPTGDAAILALHNVSGFRQPISLNLLDLGIGRVQVLREIVSGDLLEVNYPEALVFDLKPYQVAWLKPQDSHQVSSS